MTKKDIAKFLNVDIKTLYNWQKNRPNLYETIIRGLAINEVIEQCKKNVENLEKVSK